MLANSNLFLEGTLANKFENYSRGQVSKPKMFLEKLKKNSRDKSQDFVPKTFGNMFGHIFIGSFIGNEDINIKPLIFPRICAKSHDTFFHNLSKSVHSIRLNF